MKRNLIAAAVGISVLGFGIGASSAVGQTTSTGSGQAYPNKPIRIVTGGVGSGTDFPARFVAEGLTVSLGQPVIVDNRGSGLIPGEIVAKAPPDGYTLLVAGGTHTAGPFFQEAHYDPVKDFLPITWMTRSPTVLVVHPLVAAKSVKELIALAKARPRELNYASSAAGASTHLAAELFKAMAGVDIVRIPYKSGATQMADLIGGQVQLTFGNAPVVMPHIKSGRLRGLAVTTAQPSALVPGLPTIAASGLTGYESEVMNGMFAPARTSATIINRLNQEIVRVLNTAEAKERLFNAGVEAVGSSPQEYGAKIRSEIAKYGKLIKDFGLKAD